MARLALPVWFQAPAEPIRIRPIRIDSATTGRQFTLRTVLAARRYTVPAAILTALHQVCEAMVPVIMGLAIDRAVATSDPGQLLVWVLLLAVDFAVLSFSYRFGSRIGLLGMQAIQHYLRTAVTERMLHPSDSAAANRLPGTALSIATADVSRLAGTVAVGVYPVGELAAVIFGGVVLLSLSWPLGLAVLLGAPLLLALMDRAGARLRKRSGHEQELAAAASGRAADLVGGYRVLKGLNAEAEASRRYEEVSHDALEGTLHAKTAQGSFLGWMELATGCFLAAVAVAAGLQAIHGNLGIGGLITVIGLTQFLMEPLGAFASNFGIIWAAGTASAERILDVLRPDPADAAERPSTARPASRVRTASPGHPGELELDAVSVGQVRNLQVVLRPGECVGIAADGTAATALVELLSMRRVPEGGGFSYGGIDVADLGVQAIRTSILVAPHAADLFDGTISDNVLVPGTTPTRMAEALEAAGCADVLAALPEGAQTQVGEGGTRLSGGQRQRIALARALAVDAPVLVLHDPTTSVDSVTEARIAARLRAFRGPRSTLIISRSPTLLAIVDRVVDLDGKIVGGKA